jgi:hypothetical protein
VFIADDRSATASLDSSPCVSNTATFIIRYTKGGKWVDGVGFELGSLVERIALGDTICSLDVEFELGLLVDGVVLGSLVDGVALGEIIASYVVGSSVGI